MLDWVQIWGTSWPILISSELGGGSEHCFVGNK